MTYATKASGTWVELRPTFPVIAEDGRQASWETFTSLSKAEQESLGGFLVPEPTTPAGKIETGRFLKPTGAKPAFDVTYADIPAPGPEPVPETVTNYQARAIMRLTAMPDGRSLLETVKADLQAAAVAAKILPDMDPLRIQAELAWESWEQANVYERQGPLVLSLSAQYGFTPEVTDELFRQAGKVAA